MSKVTCTRKLECDTGHRVYGHENKCAHAHGHRYVFFITAQAEQSLDAVGRVIDFSVLKEKVGGWIDENWDHGFILWERDPACDFMTQFPLNGEKQKLFKLPYNPTAENLAFYLLKVVCPAVLAGTGVSVVRVVCQETPNCAATAQTVARDGDDWVDHA